SSRRRHTRFSRDWSSDVCSSDLDFKPNSSTISQIKVNSSTPFVPSSEVANKSRNCCNLSDNEPEKLNNGCTLTKASSEIPLASISALTPSSPILSNLSKATVKSISLSLAPITSAIPDNTFLLLIFMVTPSTFKSVKTASYNCTNSTSCHNDFDPTTSASHW